MINLYQKNLIQIGILGDYYQTVFGTILSIIKNLFIFKLFKTDSMKNLNNHANVSKKLQNN